MDGMRPDRDELDQFKNRKNNKNVSSKASGVTKTVEATKMTASHSSRPVSVASNRPASAAQSNSQERKASPLFTFLALILCALCAGLAWFAYQQQVEVADLKASLEDASGFIGQSKLLMARFEGELSETGAELEQSGSAAAKKLAFLDSEMRKLWGISNDRNKKAIKVNEEGLSAMQGQIKKMLSQEKLFVNELEDYKSKLASLTQRNATLLKQVKGLEGQVSITSNEMVVLKFELDEKASILDEALAQVKQERAQEKERVAGLLDRLGDSEQSIASIDASRRQLNERIVELERKLNAASLSTSGSSDLRQ